MLPANKPLHTSSFLWNKAWQRAPQYKEMEKTRTTQMKTITTCIAIAASLQLFAQKNEEPARIPFEGIDMTWQNGSDRRDSAVFSGKYFTPVVMLDVNYTYSSNNPIDNTVVGST